jgi:aspartate/methionine/tyrosine aminotransferase
LRSGVNPQIQHIGPYTLRATDVTGIANEVIRRKLPFIDGRLGDPTAYGFKRPLGLVRLDSNDGYTDSRGLPTLRETLRRGNPELVMPNCQIVRATYELPIESVFIGSGISGITRALFTALTTRSDSAVAVPKWSYIIYLAEAGLSGAPILNVPLDSSGQIDLNQLESLLITHPEIKALFITSVGNPLGVSIDHARFEEIVGIVNKFENSYNRPLYLVVDTIYEAFRSNGTHLDPIEAAVRLGRVGPTIDLYSGSKLLTVPGWRVGSMRLHPGDGSFKEEIEAFRDAFALLAQPTLGPVSTDHQNDIASFYGSIQDGRNLESFLDFRRTRVEEVRRRVTSFATRACSLSNVVVHPAYYGSNDIFGSGGLDSFYVLVGINHRLLPRGDKSQALRFAEFLLEQGRHVVLTTPGDSFLQTTLRGKDPQEYFRVVALFGEEAMEEAVDGLRAFGKSFR